ncbi:hypothetical protein Tco_0546169 [Tanacetum coccineum]
MDGTPMEINMLVEKKYPLIKELLEKMLNLQLEAEEESTMAFELIKFIKSMLEEYLERHEEQIEEILNHLDELSLGRIEHIEDKIEAELRESHTQIAKLQRKKMGNNNKIALARFRIANLEQIIEDIQVRHQADKESLLDAIYEHKNSQEGPSDY